MYCVQKSPTPPHDKVNRLGVARPVYRDGFFISFIHEYLKGHGNEADFLGFLHKSVQHSSFTLHIEPFRFWPQIRGDIHNQKTTPQLGDANRYNFFQAFKKKKIKGDSTLHPRLIFC
jgi:hypothetical protein